MLHYALDPADSGRKVRTQKPGVGSLVREPANGGESQVDSRRGVLGLFKADPVTRHNGFQNRCFDCSRFGSFSTALRVSFFCTSGKGACHFQRALPRLSSPIASSSRTLSWADQMSVMRGVWQILW